MIQDKIFLDEKDPTGLSYNTPFTVYGSYQGRLWSKTPSGSIQYYSQNSDLSAYATTGSNQFNGSQTITGSLTVTGGISGSSAESASYALNADKIDNLDSTQLVLTSSFNSYTSSASSSVGSLSSSVATTTSGLGGRITTIEGNYATTGSNIFLGSQVITGSICSNGNIVTTGQIVAQTINVQQVTSSIVYSCGSNIFGTDINNTQQFTGSMFITGSNIRANVGTACFQGSVCAPTVSIGSCLLINQTSPVLDVTTKVEMSGIGSSSAYSQASYNVFANHGTNSTWIGYLNFNKSRGTTQGSVTTVVNGDRIGMVRFSGADGSEQIRATEIYSEVDGTVSKCCVPGRIIFATTGNNLDGPIERFRISNTGVSTISGEGLFINRPTVSSGEPYIFWQKNGTNRGAIYGADGVSGLRYFGSSHCFEGTVCMPSLRVQSAFADLTLCGSNTTSPHLGGTFSITTNQDALGRTIIGNGPVGRAIYLENNGQTIFNCGVKFGNGSSCLNYYEQGTFSPAFAGSTSGCGVPSGGSAALGYYTRIGNQVFLTVAVNSSTFPSYSGDLRMYLPFTAWDGGGLNSVTYHGPPIYFYPLPNWGSSYCINDITTYILGATNYLSFNIYGLGTDRQNTVTSANTNLSGAAGIYTRFSINYTAV